MRAALTIAAATLAAGLLAWLCVAVNLERSCVVRDSPYLDLCGDPPHGSPAHIAALRSRIAANPGDAKAYVELAVADPSTSRESSIAAASTLAPNEPNLLMARAAAALDRQDWRQAAPALIQLTEYPQQSRAAMVLAAMIAAGHGELLSAYLTPGSRWLSQVLAQMTAAKAPFSSALPLVVQAFKAGILDARTVLAYVRQLKSTGAWVDAYSLWLSLQGKPLPVIYNGGFDASFQPEGFDWEVASHVPANRAGAFVERRGAEQRGAVLDVRFTGRAIPTPLVRQYLFLGAGTYRLRGDYMARQLRSEHGFAWTVKCTAAAAEAGKSAALVDTGGIWQPFSFEFSVPPGCGMVASLELGTFAPLDAALGARGRIAFDAFSLEKTGGERTALR